MRCFLVSILLWAASHVAAGAEVHAHFPAQIDPDGRYLFYSHGFIVEGSDPKPTHPQFGVYDFPAVKQALAYWEREANGTEGEELHLIAVHRPKGADPYAYGEKLAAQVEQLLQAGVPAHHITIAGFSRGGFITAVASSKLANTPVNTVILAGCAQWVESLPQIKINGHFLSIYETSDAVGSCEALAARSAGVISFEEIAISTGKSHGAFYTPQTEWVAPLKQWLRAR